MLNMVSIGLAGGTIVEGEGISLKIGQESVGYRITEKALIFGGDTRWLLAECLRCGL